MCPLVVKIQFEHIKNTIEVFYIDDYLLENLVSKIGHFGSQKEPKIGILVVREHSKKIFNLEFSFLRNLILVHFIRIFD